MVLIRLAPIFTASGQQVLACPHASGGKDWESVYGQLTSLTNAVFIGKYDPQEVQKGHKTAGRSRNGWQSGWQHWRLLSSAFPMPCSSAFAPPPDWQVLEEHNHKAEDVHASLPAPDAVMREFEILKTNFTLGSLACSGVDGVTGR